MPAIPKQEVVFDIFRYQILPKSSVQLDLFDGTRINVAELKKRKNEFFETSITEEKNKFFDSYSDELKHKLITKDKNFIVFRLGKHKDVLLVNDDFEEEEHGNLPSVLIIIDNDPSVQKIAISRDYDAFSTSFVVANILQENFTAFCTPYNLEVIISPILDKNDFWELIKKYEHKITQLKFELIRPNLANIVGKFKDEIRELTDSTNSLITTVELEAAKNSALEHINQENPRIKVLADYAIQGGSQSITMKVKGIKNKIKTNKTIITTSIDSVELSGNPKDVLKAYERIIQNE